MKEDSQSNKVYAALRRNILSNQLLPGARLKEDEWALKTDVSRVSVREALNRLLGESLLVAGEKGGYFVKSMSAESLREIREIRELLEIGALKLAFRQVTPEHIAELEQICDDFSRMVNSGYYSGACEADVKFHETLINISGNSKLKLVYEISNIPLFHLKLGQLHSRMDDYSLTDREHREIVQSLKENNLAAAQAYLVKHLHRGELASLEG